MFHLSGDSVIRSPILLPSVVRISPVNDGTGRQAVRCGYVENYLDAGGENASGNQKKVVVRTSVSGNCILLSCFPYMHQQATLAEVLLVRRKGLYLKQIVTMFVDSSKRYTLRP